MPNDVNIKIKAEGAEQVKREVDQVARSAEQVGKQANDAGRQGAEGLHYLENAAEKNNGIFRKWAKEIVSWGAKLFGITAIIGAITQAMRANTQAMEENARVAADQQKKLTTLQFIGSMFKEEPELRKEVEAYSAFGRRPFEEVATSWYTLRSNAGNLSKAQQRGIMLEALEMGRTAPDESLDTLINMFSLYAKKTGVSDINRIQNVLQKTVEVAGGTMGDVSRYMPEFLPIGMAGGLGGAEAAGLWAYATTQLSNPSVATTGLRSTFLGIQGRGTPEGAKLLKQLKIAPGTPFFQAIGQLSAARQAGRFGLAEAEQLAGREGAAVLLDILNNPQAMMQSISAVTGADRGDIDITQTAIRGLMGQDEMARMEEESRRLGVILENTKGSDQEALRFKTFLQAAEIDMRRQGYSGARIAANLALLKTLRSGGASVESLEQNFGKPNETYAAEQEPFLSWYDDVAQQHGLNPDPYADPNAPEAQYDWFSAYKAGVKPGVNGLLPETYKSEYYSAMAREKSNQPIIINHNYGDTIVAPGSTDIGPRHTSAEVEN